MVELVSFVLWIDFRFKTKLDELVIGLDHMTTSCSTSLGFNLQINPKKVGTNLETNPPPSISGTYQWGLKFVYLQTCSKPSLQVVCGNSMMNALYKPACKAWSDLIQKTERGTLKLCISIRISSHFRCWIVILLGQTSSPGMFSQLITRAEPWMLCDGPATQGLSSSSSLRHWCGKVEFENVPKMMLLTSFLFNFGLVLKFNLKNLMSNLSTSDLTWLQVNLGAGTWKLVQPWAHQTCNVELELKFVCGNAFVRKLGLGPYDSCM